MQHKKKYGLALAIAAALAAPSAFATNGYFSHGYSIKEKGMAGVGAALPQDSLAAATNPAGMVMVGSRLDVGASLFSPHRSYTVRGMPSGAPGTFGLFPETVDSESEYFLIPHFGWNRMLNADSSVGVSVYGNGGMNTDYPRSAGGGFGVFGAGMVPGAERRTGVDLAQLFVNVTYAQKITPTSSWGISPILAYQRFKARGLAAFGGFSTDPTKLTDNDYDSSTGLGAKIGIMGEVAPGVTLGGSYQTKVRMSELDDYRGLFAEKGDFDIPSTATVGVAWKVTPASVLAFDVQRIWYTDVASVSNPLMPALGACGMGDVTQCLGTSNGSGFGWDDMTIYKIGYQWDTSQAWTWRVGYSYGEQPIPSSEVLFNILAPGVIEQHLTFGFTNRLSNMTEWSFFAMYAPEKEVSGPNPLEAPGAQRITLRMDQWEVGASWGMKF